ncbi:HCL283Wp [Eremothecium sinecaudum]|uniref:HCL283Wp n=1 Tax=Eremothecium sinecaudum TaxID=45286 RepID=A0A109UYN4_9SACH|nr:HCL283Wp [Eremothecium sinecaudum]AMD19868.1 HCL283Wp [Eremothecium sinecaudum]
MLVKDGKSNRFLRIKDHRSLSYARLFLILHCILVCLIIILQVFAFPFQIITHGSTLTLWVFYVHICLFIASQFVLFKALRKSISIKVYSLLASYAFISSIITVFCFWVMFHIIQQSADEYFITVITNTHIDVTERIVVISVVSFICSLFSSILMTSSLLFYKHSYTEHGRLKRWLKHDTVKNNLLLMNNNDKHIFECFDTPSSSDDGPKKLEVILPSP